MLDVGYVEECFRLCLCLRSICRKSASLSLDVDSKDNGCLDMAVDDGMSSPSLLLLLGVNVNDSSLLKLSRCV